jgi:outer membrane receptor protein involved in Fe transport
MYAPIESVALRGTIGEAVRAPNIEEAFSAIRPSFASINDPCDADIISDDPDRTANCAALGIPAGWEAADSVSIETLSGGNDQLTPETSSSLTVGAIWTPSFLEDFSITLDYYDIEIEDAIIEVAAQDIIDNCVDSSSGLDDIYCGAIDRDPADLNIDLVRSGFLNASAYNAAGIDMEMRYGIDLGELGAFGSVDLKLFVGKLLELEKFEFQDRPDEIDLEKGEEGDPELQARFTASYTLNDMKISWTTRYIDSVARFKIGQDTPEDISPAFIPSITTHDLALDYIVNDNVQFNVGLRNLFDKVPPGYSEDALYDLVGRRMYANVKVSF